MLLGLRQYRVVLGRGLRRRCPQCGRGRVFSGWHTLVPACDHCGLDFLIYDTNTWAFMYLSTAGITGVIVVGMLLFPPTNRWLGRGVVLAVAVGLILGTLPLRKSVAIAVEYLVDLRSDHRTDLRLRMDE